MSDQSKPNPTSSNGAIQTDEEPRRSLRDIAEASYDQVIESAENETVVDEGSVRRDERGRFAPKNAQPGEAEPQAPSPEPPVSEAQQPPPEPAPEGSSTRPPDHWSAEDRANFDKLTPEGQNFLLRRHSEMEADYTRKSQASAGAVNFANALAPVFNDPVISRSLQESGVDPVRAVMEWAAFHRRAMNPEPRERFNLLADIAQRIGFDPARLFAQPSSGPPPLSEKEAADPAVRYFADHLGRITSDQQALRAELQRLSASEARAVQQAEAQALEATRWGIDSFAGEKDAQGNPLRPDFDAVLPRILTLFRGDPNITLPEAYDQARWADKKNREALLTQERGKVANQNGIARAQAAVRGNTRGLTAPVSKPSSPSSGTTGLRGILEKSADEVGF